MKTTVLLAALLLTSALARADDHNVDLDKSTDFSKLKSFMIQPGKIDSSRQELNNAIVLGKITDAIRTTLLSKGLMEVAARPDVTVEFTASGVDYNVGPGGIANPINASRGDRGGRGAPRSERHRRKRPRGFQHRYVGCGRENDAAIRPDLARRLP